MKSLSNYTTAPQTALFKTHGAFFAFSNSQFDEQKTEGVTYCQITSGLIAPKEHAKAVVDGLAEINRQGIEQDIKENGESSIIRRELANYECTYTYNLDDCIDALDDYATITVEMIQAEFRKVLELEACEA
jgi:hypothetical protein